METTKYNGWTNRETWNVALWLDNDENLYNACRSAKIESAEGMKHFCIRVFGETTPDGDHLNKVNFTEVFDDLLSDID